MRELRCADLGFDCAAVVKADTDDQILEQVAAHAQSAHSLAVTPEMVPEIRSKIRDVPASSA